MNGRLVMQDEKQNREYEENLYAAAIKQPYRIKPMIVLGEESRGVVRYRLK